MTHPVRDLSAETANKAAIVVMLQLSTFQTGSTQRPTIRLIQAT